MATIHRLVGASLLSGAFTILMCHIASGKWNPETMFTGLIISYIGAFWSAWEYYSDPSESSEHLFTFIGCTCFLLVSALSLYLETKTHNKATVGPSNAAN